MIKTLHERSKAIQDRVSRLTRSTTCKTASTVQNMEGQLGSISNTTEKIEFGMDETKRGVKTMEAFTVESRSDIKQIKSDFEQKNKKDEEAYKRQDTALGNLTDMMQNQVKKAQCASLTFAIEANAFDFNLIQKKYLADIKQGTNLWRNDNAKKWNAVGGRRRRGEKMQKERNPSLKPCISWLKYAFNMPRNSMECWYARINYLNF